MEQQTDKKNNNFTQTEIQDWLVSYLSEVLEIKPEEIDVAQNLQDYGLDSSGAVVLTGDLGQWLSREIDPTLLIDYQTITAIAQYLANTEEIEI